MNDDEYLWQRTGRDPEIERLESLLGRFRAPEAKPPVHVEIKPRDTARILARAAAIIVLLTGIAVIYAYLTRNRWQVRAEHGVANVRSGAWLKPGDSLHTSRGATLSLAAPAIGRVDLAENTTLSLLQSRSDQHVFALESGTIHARTTSPPGVFIVRTPSARAIDLGCEYTLTVDEQGNGLLHVKAGWVELAQGFDQALVPAGASGEINDRGTLTPPYFDDAPPAFKHAVHDFAFTYVGDPARARGLDTMLALARKRDALTLLNLFSRSTSEERYVIWGRLNELVPAPSSIPRTAMESWNVRTDEAWWPLVFKASGVSALKKGKNRIVHGP